MAPPPVRQLPTKVVREFRGISQWRNVVTIPMDHALNLLNVIVSSAGSLAKLRIPTPLTTPPNFPVAGIQNAIDTFFDYQKGDGTRQLVFNAGKCLGFYVVGVNAQGVEIVPYNFNVIDDNNANNTPRWSWCESNNVLYGANGKRMAKWTGAALQQMGIGTNGINPPAPTIGVRVPLVSIQRNANVVTFDVTPPVAIDPTIIIGGFNRYQISVFPIGMQITIDGVVTDPTLNGNFAISANPPATFKGKYASNGANTALLAEGNLTVYYQIQKEPTPNTDYQIDSVQRTNGIAFVQIGKIDAFLPGENITIQNLVGANASINGTYKVLSQAAAVYQVAQPGQPDVALNFPVAQGDVFGGITDLVTGRTWRYAYANSVTGEVGPASLPSLPMPGGGLLSDIRAFLTAPPPNPADAQIDTIWWFGTQDGGGDYGLVRIAAPIGVQAGITAVGSNVLGDAMDDTLIDLTQQAPILNYAPPIGSKLAKFQGRLFLAGIIGSPQDIAYSAYEQVLVGNRPEECWFPNNRLRLAIGADDIRGFGVIMPGVVAFSHSNQMFMFQGQVEDVTTTLPVNFSALLQELPWATGTVSHAAIQSTPYGIVWVGADLTVKIWNGIFYGTIIGPRDLSINIYPLMQRITPGTAPSIQSAFFNWVERDWYVINLCLDGSLTPNYLVFFSLSQEDSDNLGVFIAQVAADSLGVREDNNGGRHLLISSGGIIYELKASSTTTSGVNNQVTATAGQLNAYWESGYLGSDNSHQFKMFRYGHIIADNGGYNILAKFVDDDTYKFNTPLSKLLKVDGSQFTADVSARRSNLTIIFPPDDVDTSVQQLDYSVIPGGER